MYRICGRLPWKREIIWILYDWEIDRKWRWTYRSCSPGDQTIFLFFIFRVLICDDVVLDHYYLCCVFIYDYYFHMDDLFSYVHGIFSLKGHYSFQDFICTYSKLSSPLESFPNLWGCLSQSHASQAHGFLVPGPGKGGRFVRLVTANCF